MCESIFADVFSETESSARQTSENNTALEAGDSAGWVDDGEVDDGGTGVGSSDAWDYPDPSLADSGSDGLVMENVEDRYDEEDAEEDPDFVMEEDEDHENTLSENQVRVFALDSRLVPINRLRVTGNHRQ